MTVCPQCNGSGGMYTDTDYVVRYDAGTKEQNSNNQSLGVVGCSQCNGKGYLTNFGVA
jgi:type II secretory ATPase GspE/PulE/Tfp pilus assembly ATPase PilB-like protein